LDILLKPQQAAEYGLSVGATNQAIQTLLRGTKVGQVYEADQVFDVIVRASPEIRDDPRRLGDVLLDSPLGHPVPLGAVADIDIVSAPNMINREQGRRRLLVTCNADGRDVESVMADIQRQLREGMTLPAGYHFEFAGEFVAKAESQQRLLTLSGLSLLGILLLLYIDCKSLKLSLLIMVCVPLSCVGGIASVMLSGGDLSLGSLVGFITVFGIAVRNGILLISNFQRSDAASTSVSLDLILTRAVERLAPILMTAGTTALAIVPLIVTGNLPGHEIEHPMAIVIVGGLVSSTLLTLLVLPTLYGKIAR
jgi:Cu/Ag efflux pump CusA